MNPLIISGLFTAAQSLIERFFPDPEKKAAAQLELLTSCATFCKACGYCCNKAR